MWATNGRIDSEWDRMSCLLAMIANTNRDSKKHPKGFSPEQFHPGKQKLKRAPVVNKFSDVLSKELEAFKNTRRRRSN